jgi:hypothetical protein
MSHAVTSETSEAARLLSRARWGNQGLRNAVATVVERQAELDEQLRAELRQVTEAGQDLEAGQ